MSIFFPDNDKRKSRLIELSTDSQQFLIDAKQKYSQFVLLTKEVNAQIVDVYRRAGLTPPANSSVDIIESTAAAGQVAKADTAVEISNLVLSVGSVAATALYFAPAATAALVDTGVLTAEAAGTVLVSVLGAELTVGALAGGLIGGLVVGVVVVAIGFVIDAIEGAVLRDHLRKGIRDTDQIRASLRMSLDKTSGLLDLLQGVKTTLDSLSSVSIPLTDEIIINLINKNAAPALAAVAAITHDSVLAELSRLDSSRGSWTNEDASGSDINLPAPPSPPPVYASYVTLTPEKLCPSIPGDLKLTFLSKNADINNPIISVRDIGQPGEGYPVLNTSFATYWALSYIDNREGMAILAFDKKGDLIARWDKLGARYIWSIEVDDSQGKVKFIGQVRDTISMTWSELTNNGVLAR